MAAGRNIYGCRSGRLGECGVVATSYQAGGGSLSEAGAAWKGSVGYRAAVAAHVSEHDGLWTQRHWYDGDQRGGYCVVGSAGEGREPASLSIAWRSHQATDSCLCEPPLCDAARTTGFRGEALQGRRLPGDEVSLRMGAARWSCGHAAQRGVGANGA